MLKGQETLDKTSFLPRFVCRFFVRYTCTCVCKTEGKTRVCLFTFEYTGELLETLFRLGSSRLISSFRCVLVCCLFCLFAWIFLLFMFMSKRALVKSSSFNFIPTTTNSFLWRKKKKSVLYQVVFLIVGSKNCFNLLFIVCCFTYLYTCKGGQQFFLTRCIHYLF